MWRGYSLRTLALLLGGPLLVDLLGSCFLFWMNLGAVRMGYPPRTQMLIMALFAFSYTIGAHLSGRWVTSRRAPRLVFFAALALTIEGTIALFTPIFGVYLAVAMFMGVTMSHYFMPFQVMMGNVSPFRVLAWTIAVYTISWGSGWASGPLLSGFIGQVSPVHLAIAAWGLFVAYSILTLIARGAPQRDENHVQAHAAFASTPTMRLMGAASVCAVITVTSALGATLWVGMGEARGYGDGQIGAGVAALALPVPLLALLWARLGRLLHLPWLMIGGLLLGAAGVAVLPLTDTYVQAMTCLSCLGVMSSIMFFHGVYYANADPDNRTKSVARYESVVGLGQLIGPTLMGLIAWHDPTAYRAYGFGAALLVAMAVCFVIMRRQQA